MIASIATAVAMFLLQLLAPYKPKQFTGYEMLIQQHRTRYSIYEAASLLPLFFFVSLITYVFYSLGNDLQAMIFSNRETDFAIYPPTSFWLAPGMCFGFGLILTPMDLLYHLLLREEYPAYIEYTNQKHGYDGFRVMRPLCMLFTAVGLVASILALDWYTEIKEDKIILNEFFAFSSKEYCITDVQSVTQYEKTLTGEGKVKPDLHYQIIFLDGYTWNTASNAMEVPQEKYTAIARFIAQKANLKIVAKEVDAN